MVRSASRGSLKHIKASRIQ